MPYSFPSGATLVKEICSMGMGKKEILQQASGESRDTVEEFIHDLKLAQITIDTFLGRWPEFAKIGKTAIAMTLVTCERDDKLYWDGNDDHWYQHLLGRMEAPFDEFHANELSFITFNYDRSLEHFLFNSIRSGFGKSPDDVRQVLECIPIVHVHGVMGLLEWQSTGGAATRNYEYTADPDTIRIAAEGIKTISDEIDDTPEFRQAHELLENSSRVFILGFQYHPENMRRLRIPFGIDGKEIFGTCFEMTQPEADVLKTETCKGINLGAINHKSTMFLRQTPAFFRP